MYGRLNGFLKILGTYKGEESRVLLLLGVGFFMGIFVAAYEVSAISKYIDNLDFDQLPEGIALSGLVGIISTFIFSRAQSQLRFGTLAVTSFLLICFIIAAFSAGFYALKAYPEYLDGRINETSLSKAAFILMGSINAISVLIFWGVFSRLFNIRQSKRLAGGIDSGQVIASIVAFLSIALVDLLVRDKAGNNIDLLEHTHILLIISAACVIGCMFFVVYILRTSTLIEPEQTEGIEKKNWGKGLVQLFSNRYVLMIAAFVAISAISATFIEFGFFKSLSIQSDDILQDKKLEITAFVSFFEATVLILGFLIQTFLNDKLMEMYGLKVSLLILPVILLFFVSLSLPVGIFGEDGRELTSIITSLEETPGLTVEQYEEENQVTVTDAITKFGFFFALLAIINLFTQSLRDALESPAVKMLYMPLNAEERLSAQTNIEGIVGQLATFIGGVALLFLVKINFEQTHLHFLLLGFVGLWFFITIVMHNRYKGALQSTLAKHAEEDDKLVYHEESLQDLLAKDIQKGSVAKVIYHIRLMEQLEPARYEAALLTLLTSDKKEIRSYGLSKIVAQKLVGARWDVRKLIDRENDPVIKQQAGKAFRALEELTVEKASSAQLLELAKSTNPKDRVMIARYLEADVPDELLPQHMLLLRDHHEEVRKAAIIAAGKNRRPELWPLLVENLSQQLYATTAASAIIGMGEAVVDVLDVSFYRSEQTQQAMVRIIQVMGQVGGSRALEALWSKIDYPDRKISGQAMIALGKLGFHPDESQVTKIRNAIELDIKDIAWNFAAINEVEQDEEGLLLVQAIREENARHMEHLYLLLSMTYDAQSIHLVKDNIEKGTAESVGYALELLDIFVDENQKPLLRALFDDVDDAEKASRLEGFYPRTALDNNEVLLALINRDYNHTSRWVKACALYKIAVSDQQEVPDDIVANMFNPGTMLRELAAWVVYQKDRKKFDNVLLRLNEDTRKELVRLLNRPDTLEYLRFGLVRYLKETPVFKGMDSEQLLEIADHLNEIHLREGVCIYDQQKEREMPVIIVRKGRLGIMENEALLSEIKPGMIVGETLALDADFHHVVVQALEETICYTVNKDRFFELAAHDQKVIQHVVHVITKDIMAENGLLS